MRTRAEINVVVTGMPRPHRDVYRYANIISFKHGRCLFEDSSSAEEYLDGIGFVPTDENRTYRRFDERDLVWMCEAQEWTDGRRTAELVIEYFIGFSFMSEAELERGERAWNALC